MRYVILVFFVFFVLPANAQNALFDKLENNVKEVYLKNRNREAELKNTIAQFKNVSGKKSLYINKYADSNYVNKLIKNFTPKGIWNDLDYGNKVSGWEPAFHADRILALTLLYIDTASIYYQNSGVKSVIHLALKYWFDSKPICKNWWFNEIGIPKTLGPVFIFLKNELTETELAGAIEVMDKSSFKQTGQNKVWQAGNILLKAILLKNGKLIKQARDSIFSELHISNDEGIKADYSFHQHGPQQQFGNYGMAFINSMSFWARIVSGTSLAMDNDKIGILRNLIIDGYSWVSWKGYFDINSLGRFFATDILIEKSMSAVYVMLDMLTVDPLHKNDYLNLILSNYGTQNGSRNPIGTKHFWRSDMTVHRSGNWFSSVKLSSKRVQATEAGNGENLLGYNIGSGTTFIEVNGNEYDNIFPYWNWKKLPGVTNTQGAEPLPILSWAGYKNNDDYAGGVIAGTTGITAFHLNRDSLQGNKSWFYINDKLVCLGSGIVGKKEAQVYTTINQANLNGGVSFLADNENKLAKESSFISDKIKWVWHNKVGYYFYKNDSINVISKTQSGKWAQVVESTKDNNLIKREVFTLEIKHDMQKPENNYAYIMLPASGIEQLRTFKPEFSIEKNDGTAQIIIQNDKAVGWFAIYKPVEILVAGFCKINFKQPGLYIIEKRLNKIKVSVSDASQKLKVITIYINDKHVLIKLPQGQDAGKTTNKQL